MESVCFSVNAKSTYAEESFGDTADLGNTDEQKGTSGGMNRNDPHVVAAPRPHHVIGL